MKTTLFMMIAILCLSFSKPCYKVTEVKSSVDAPEMKTERVIFGIKQLVEESLSEEYDLCENGSPIVVEIVSIEAPSVGISIGPFMKKSKETTVTIKITKDDEEYIGEGNAVTSVTATFIDLNDENLPFNKTSFAGALKKSIENAISKM
jgi:hypothetical protein